MAVMTINARELERDRRRIERKQDLHWQMGKGEILAVIRELLRLTTADVEHEIGSGRMTVSRLEHGLGPRKWFFRAEAHYERMAGRHWAAVKVAARLVLEIRTELRMP